ncbi:chromosome segregation protein SMC [Eshraghiella crossota]|mgnify:FL=1|uniref:chromosome segregation protein SMC n=1 Tax=Eshraghiella crossota TaxID=45851 RepID=UPI003FD8049B
MYLKKIEVQGFKSFANKLLFEFDNGITGIVGPNGSGKSNIADAVRWVLGEQSAKQLRGSKMEDIIFAGTETRKPVSFASVSLTIDNSDKKLDIDYSEVTVTRRVFRSGESEYLLNGNTCRLKDINELFYDTGIGKEGYSIIGQGQIDKILSGKAEERRELFDEAAGIVKFKKRKNETQKSLDNESQNLIRINDILAELEKQVGPLARQSDKAKEYLRLKEYLKKYEVNLFLLEESSTKGELTEVTGNLDIVNEELEKAGNRLEEIKSIYDEKDNEVSELTARIDELTAKKNQAEIDKNRLESQIEILKEQINSANMNDSHLADRLKEINDQIAERNEEKQKLLKQKFDISSEVDDVFARQNEIDREVDALRKETDGLSNEIENRKNSIFDNLNKKGTIKASIQRYESMQEQVNIRKAELTGKLINFKTDESEFDVSIKDAKDKLDSVNKEIDGLVSENNRLMALSDENKEERNTKKQKLQAAKEQNMRSQTKLESLKNIAERYDGYGNSIRKVMECKEQNSGILGVVADIVKTEKKYEIAIETALGGTIQNIVTDNEETAKKMIAYLKKNQYGRATFLPLSAVSGKNNRRDNLERESGFIGYANELVKVDLQYKGLADYLLGRCVVVDNIDNALHLNKAHGYSLKIVTLEGELLNPGGSMTGGAFRNSSNLLGRRREIEELEKVVSSTEKVIFSLSADIDRLGGLINEATDKIAKNTEIIQNKKLAKNTLEINYNQLADKKNEIQSVYENNKREEKEIESQLKDIRAELESSNKELEKIENDNELNTKEISDATERLNDLKNKLEEKNKIAESIHIEYSQIAQKSQFAEESVKRILREINRLKDGISDLEDSKEESQTEIAVRSSQIEEITDTIKTAAAEIESYSSELTDLKSRKEEGQATLKGFFKTREECQNNLVTLEKEQFRLSQNKEKLENNRDSKIEYMWNEYELTLSEATQLKDDELSDVSEIKKIVTDTKNEIRKLGDVNVNAIEDYKEVAERYEFLKNQHDDLVSARDKLITVIEELDKNMREQFTTKFEEIKIEFDKVFRQLFGGGKGTIELDPEADILDAAITIISQPPGKKLQNMMQLSGGEKALTAICLLFAIQNLKPSPFCLLDEIEAALDDSNVDRYAKYLHKLTKNTQFIVITHRRGTMAAADRLYGITMQEKGVSTLVSVDLIENQLDDNTNKN